jgi:thiol-disulfide isomerase/thioredoxin
MKKYIYIFIGLLFIAGVVWLIVTPGRTGAPTSVPGKYDQFAQCLKDKGTIFYGAFWCPHCQAQKAEFGNSAKLLPYVECSTPDGQGQTQVCKDAGIVEYPTWQFNASTTDRITGDVTLATLAEKTSCALPQ